MFEEACVVVTPSGHLLVDHMTFTYYFKLFLRTKVHKYTQRRHGDERAQNRKHVGKDSAKQGSPGGSNKRQEANANCQENDHEMSLAQFID